MYVGDQYGCHLGLFKEILKEKYINKSKKKKLNPSFLISPFKFANGSRYAKCDGEFILERILLLWTGKICSYCCKGAASFGATLGGSVALNGQQRRLASLGSEVVIFISIRIQRYL